MTAASYSYLTWGIVFFSCLTPLTSVTWLYQRFLLAYDDVMSADFLVLHSRFAFEPLKPIWVSHLSTPSCKINCCFWHLPVECDANPCLQQRKACYVHTQIPELTIVHSPPLSQMPARGSILPPSQLLSKDNNSNSQLIPQCNR